MLCISEVSQFEWVLTLCWKPMAGTLHLTPASSSWLQPSESLSILKGHSVTDFSKPEHLTSFICTGPIPEKYMFSYRDTDMFSHINKILIYIHISNNGIIGRKHHKIFGQLLFWTEKELKELNLLIQSLYESTMPLRWNLLVMFKFKLTVD